MLIKERDWGSEIFLFSVKSVGSVGWHGFSENNFLNSELRRDDILTGDFSVRGGLGR